MDQAVDPIVFSSVEGYFELPNFFRTAARLNWEWMGDESLVLVGVYVFDQTIKAGQPSTSLWKHLS